MKLQNIQGNFLADIVKVKTSSGIQITIAVSMKQPQFHIKWYKNMRFKEQTAVPALQPQLNQ